MTHVLTVWIEWNNETGKNEIRYSNGTGNLTIRGTGDRPQPRIRFDLVNDDWTFDAMTFLTIEGIPVQPDGSDVFENQTIFPSRTIELTDRLNLQDVGTTHRYKYTLRARKIGDGKTEPVTSDPELQNQREPKMGGS
jgi:hypothetical protein